MARENGGTNERIEHVPMLLNSTEIGSEEKALGQLLGIWV